MSEVLLSCTKDSAPRPTAHTFTALRSSLTNAPCGNARRQGISPPPLDDSPAQGPYLLPGPRTPVAFATHYRLSLGLRFAPSSPPVTPLGSQPPCSVGQSWNPYRHPYRTAFASSRSCTCYAFPRTYAWATRAGSLAESVSGLPRSAGCTNKRG